jgi:hypothetical protein
MSQQPTPSSVSPLRRRMLEDIGKDDNDIGPSALGFPPLRSEPCRSNSLLPVSCVSPIDRTQIGVISDTA